MINLNATPSELLTVKHGDQVSVQGRAFVVQVVPDFAGAEMIYLTTSDSRVREYHSIAEAVERGGVGDGEAVVPAYRSMITHLRKSDISQAAMMTRQQMIDCIVTGAYTIS